jgi:hypothetical protein
LRASPRFEPAVVGIGLALGLLVCACGEDPPDSGSEVFFPTDLRAGGYVQVRACRSPGEHSALGGFTVWTDPESSEAFDALWAGTITEMPPGAIVVKENYGGSDCGAPEDVVGWVGMRKEPGEAPESGDWRWQEVSADGELRVDGADPGCIGCHRGSDDTTCRGYGADNGLDYICTEP